MILLLPLCRPRLEAQAFYFDSEVSAVLKCGAQALLHLFGVFVVARTDHVAGNAGEVGGADGLRADDRKVGNQDAGLLVLAPIVGALRR